MMNFKTAAAASVLALCFSAPAFASAGSLTTFAVTHDNGTSDITWTGDSNGGVLNTLSGGDAVSFQFEQITGLPSYLQGNLSAIELINGGAGVTTTATATQSTDGNFTDTQAINHAFTISYTLATPVDVGGQMLSNLLTATVTPNTGSAAISGTDGGSSATYSAATNTHNTYTVTFTSSFLKFSAGSSYSVSLALNSITPGLNFDPGSDTYIENFVANLAGTFAANPAPQIVPEAPSALLLIAGLSAVGVAARRRAKPAA